jgi:hypothetical protein
MTKRKASGVGFDLERAGQSLQAAAHAAGLRPMGIDPAKATLLQTANVHLHGLEQNGCKESPCRRAGLCHALDELAAYIADTTDRRAVVEAAAQTHEMEKFLGNSGDRYAKALSALTEYGGGFHRDGEPLSHDHETLCERPAEILLRMAQFLGSMAEFNEALRKNLWSRPPQRKSREWLLIAVWQHLDWGGFTYREIFKLVPDDEDEDGWFDRIRKRVLGPDARSSRPKELHPALVERHPPPDKRKRRRSSS